MAPSHLPLNASYIENLGIVRDDHSNPHGIFHDGGGGATQNGHHIQVFADSFTESSGFNFVHNSISYFGHANRNPQNPLHQQKFGMRGPPGARVFTGTQLGAMHAHERALGPAFTVWLINSMTPLPDNLTIIGVHPCLDCGKPESEGGGDMYSSMVAITAVDPSTLRPEDVPPTRRLGNGMLFKKGEVQYGNFACVTGLDGWLYLFGADDTGVKLARVPCTPTEMDKMADRRLFQFFHSRSDGGSQGGGGQWRSHDKPLRKNHAEGNILNWHISPMGKPLGPDTGDVFFSPYHGTLIMIFMSKFVDGEFWASYAMGDGDGDGGGRMEGPWSTPIKLWSSTLPDECKKGGEGGGGEGVWNYQGHAHPGWDPSGRTLLLSFSSGARYVSFALVTWA